MGETPVQNLRPTLVEIDLASFGHNFRAMQEKAGGAGILSIVKSNAYGHGIERISRESIKLGAKILGVVSIEEGIFLRQRGISAPILVLGSIFPLSNFSYVIEYGLRPAICSMVAAKMLSAMAEKKKKKIPVHIKIDTGMGRIGVHHKNAASFIREVASLEGIKTEGMFSHLAASDIDREFTLRQVARFSDIAKELEEDGIDVPYKHIANSTAVLNYPEARFNLVRPGIALYGLAPFAGAGDMIDLAPVLKLETKIVYLKKVLKETSVSYGRTWKAKRDSFIATLPIGYADGYSRRLSNRGRALVKGKKVPVVGRVCMDMTLIDVTGIEGVNVGDEVVLIGEQGKERITVEDIASKTGTISYEVVCGISSRVPRVYKR